MRREGAFAVSSDEVNWRTYLAEFHRERAGIAEAVLSRALSGDHSPYRWLARAVSATASTVLDLACGSGPMSRELAQPGRTVIGLDLSEHELALAVDRGPGPWIRADALQLPVRDESIDVVTSSMGLVVVQPLTRVVEEVARVLRPGGVLAAIAPAIRPLGPRDLTVLTRINGRLRTKPQFPGPVELTGFAKDSGAARDAAGRGCPRAVPIQHSVAIRCRVGDVSAVPAQYAVVAGGEGD